MSTIPFGAESTVTPTPATPAPTPTADAAPSPTTTTSAPASDSTFGARANAAANAAPKLTPDTIAGIAQSSTDLVQASVHASGASAWFQAMKVTDQLNTLNQADQLKAWRMASPSTKSLLSSTGYRPPTPEGLANAPAEGFWGSVGHAVESVGNIAKHQVYSSVDSLLHSLNEPAQLAANAIDHGVRAALANSQDAMLKSGNTWSLDNVAATLNPVDIVRHWAATTNAATTYAPETLRYLQDQGFDTATLNLAKMAASGLSIQQVINSVPKNERANAASLVMKAGSKFTDAVNLLADSHLSLGQAIFGGLNASQAKTIFPRTSSGSLDASAMLGQAVGVGGTVALGVTGDEGAAAGLGASLRAGTLLGAASMQATTATLGDMQGKTADRAVGFAPFGKSVNIASGVTDGLASWYLNPVYMGLGARTAYKSAHALSVMDALSNPNALRYTYANEPAYNRYAVRFAKLITSPWEETSVAGSKIQADANGLAHTPNLGAVRVAGMPMDEELTKIYKEHFGAVKDAVASGDNQKIGVAVGNMLGDAQSMVNVVRGRLSHYYEDATNFPSQPLSQAVVERLKGIGRKTWGGEQFSPGKMSPRNMLSAMVGDAAANSMSKEATLQKAEMGGSRLSRMAVNLLPTGPIDVTDTSGRAVTNLERTLAMALPRQRIASILSMYLNTDATDIGARRDIVNAAIGEMLRTAIDENNPQAKAWLDEVMNRQGYSASEGALRVNPYNPDGPRQAVALGPSQLSTQIGTPDWKKVYQFSKKMWLMRAANVLIDNHVIDSFMSKFWKPAILLRPGFALRFAGEEITNFMLRTSASSWLKARIAASLTDGGAAHAEVMAEREKLMAESEAGNAAATNKLDALAAWATFGGHIPEPVAKTVATAQDLVSHIYGFRAVHWMQGLGEASLERIRQMGQFVAGDELMHWTGKLAKFGVLDNAFSSEVFATLQHSDPYFAETGSHLDPALIRTPTGDPLQLERNTPFKISTADDPLYMSKWLFNLNSMSADSFMRPALRAQDLGVDGQVQAVLDKLSARKLFNDLALAQKSGDAQAEEAATRAIDKHEALLKKFSVAFSDSSGKLLSTGDTNINTVLHDWAQQIVQHVNDLTTTMHPQEALEEGKLPRIVHSPEPIQIPTPNVPRAPWRISTQDPEREISPVEPNSAYSRIGANEVRLFHPFNAKGVGELNKVSAPGRFWTPSYDHASTLSGEGGEVYSITVPKDELASRYTMHGGGDKATRIDRIIAEQHPKGGMPVDVARSHWFESGDIQYSRTTDPHVATLAQSLGAHLPVTADHLRNIPSEHWPARVIAPEMLQTADKHSFVEKVLSRGFYHMVARPADWLSRQPQFAYNYALASREAQALVTTRNIGVVVGHNGIVDQAATDIAQEKLVHDIAMERATNETIRFIHDPRARSQFSGVTRNVIPFWFAQEQFYKRWGRLFGTYPEAFYKLSQTMNGLRSVGFVTKDQYGQDSFVYPGSQAMLSLLTKIPLFGNIPISVGLSSEVNQLNPSLANGLAPWPSFGPLATIPTAVAGWMFPKEASGFAQFFQGPNAAPLNEPMGRADRLMGEILPSFISRMLQYAGTDAFASANSTSGPALFLTSEIQAMQQLEHAGYGPTLAEQNDPMKLQQYLDRVANYTKILLLTRAFVGLLSPATPNFVLNKNSNGAQLQALMQTMPYDQAVSEFLKIFPNATADTVFETTTSGINGSGAFIPATKAAGDFINANSTFFNDYPQIAPWAIPHDAARGTFNATAYEEEKNLGLRDHRSLDQYYTALKYAEGANIYYPLEQMVWAAGGAPTHADTQTAQQQLGVTQVQAQQRLGMLNASPQEIKSKWTQWADGFKKTHPIFSQQYQLEGTIAAARRGAVVSQLQAAIANGALPKTKWSNEVSQLMWTFDEVQKFDAQSKAQGGPSSERTAMKNKMILWGNTFVQEHPETAMFWNSVLQKQIGL